MIKDHFPTLRRWWQSLLGVSGQTFWRIEPWWGNDRLSARQSSLLQVLAAAHRSHVPPVELIECLALEHRGYYRRTLGSVAQKLRSGVSLISALEQTPDALRPADILALQLATQTGTLAPTYAVLLGERQSLQRAEERSWRYATSYWVALAFIIVLMLYMLMTMIVPTFKGIAQEFGIQLPSSLQMLVAVFGNTAVLLSLLLLTMVGVVLFLWLTAPRRFVQRKLLSRILPTSVQGHLAELYQLLAICIEAGRPLPGVLSTLARFHFAPKLRHQLLYARNEVEQGVEVWKSLEQAKVVSSAQAEFLAKTDSPTVATWTLRTLAKEMFTALYDRVARRAVMIETLVTLVFAAWVLWICYSMFGFLVHLVSLLS